MSLRLCRNAFRNVALSRAVAASSYPLMGTKFEIGSSQLSSNCSLVHSVNACRFHTSPVNWKKKKEKKRAAQEEESEDEADAEEEEEKEQAGEDDLAKDFRLVDCPVSALRLDTLAKVALAIPRASVEQLLVEGKIRVNGELCRKKAASVDVGTMIDLILEASPDNPDFTMVRRVIVHKIGDKTDNQGRLVVTVKKWASLIVDEYKLTADRSEKDEQ